VAGLVPARRGPKGASKLTPQLVERIAGLDAAGATLREIAAATGVSTFSVRNALGRVAPAGQGTAAGAAGERDAAGDAGPAAVVAVLPDPVPRDAERALAPWGLLGEGAVPVFTPGARYPLAGLLLALPALEAAGLLTAAREVYGRLRDGFYGHARVYYGTRTVQKAHVARLKFPAPATMETWVTDQDGDPVFMVVAEPSDSLAGEVRRLLPALRQVVGAGRRVTVCFDRGGWSPALFADITGAGFDVLTWRKGRPGPDPARRPRPGHGPPGRRGQADHPRHPDGRL
jgi:hypothetical protein